MKPFTLQRQRPNECLLAALCCYLGSNYIEASEAFHKRYGYLWGEAIKVVPSVKGVDTFQWHCLNVQSFTKDTFRIDLPLEMIRADRMLGKAPITRMNPQVWLDGGLLCVQWPSIGFHAVAYDAQSQMVYDSGNMIVVDLPKYIRQYKAILVGGWTK